MMTKRFWKPMYMHLIDGVPAGFNGKYLYVVAPGSRQAIFLCESLQQIRDEQKQDRKYRLRDGFPDDKDVQLSHLTVRV